MPPRSTASISGPWPRWRPTFGPLVDEIAVPIGADDYPDASTSNAFDTTQVLRAW